MTERQDCPPELRKQYFADPENTRLSTERELIVRASRDAVLRDRLKADPKGVAASELGLKIPDHIKELCCCSSPEQPICAADCTEVTASMLGGLAPMPAVPQRGPSR